jgi:phospholipid/cholesterol/gamma-HCH transport system substrate-binding protein
MKTFDLELFVGFALLCMIAILVYLSLRLGQVDLVGHQGYTVQALFTTAGGLQTGAVVELAGVEIGRVEQVTLDDYQARVKLKIDGNISLSEDTKAAIKSKGLVGERYVEISPGKTGRKLEPGGQIRETESPVDIQELISQFIFGDVDQNRQDHDLP